MSKILVDTIDTRSGTSTLTLGSSNAGTIALGSGDVQSNFLYPAFEAKLSGGQAVSDNSATKVQFDTEEFDTGGMYDNSSNYRFTPTVAGKYFVYLSIGLNANADTELQNAYAMLRKNGSNIKITHHNYVANNIRFGTTNVNAVVSLNGSSDYIEAFVQGADSSGNNNVAHGEYSTFGAYRIGT